LKRQIIFRQRDKQTIGWFNAVTGDAPEDLVFSNTLPCGFRIRDRIARAAVEQAVITPGCPCRDIMAFKKCNA